MDTWLRTAWARLLATPRLQALAARWRTRHGALPQAPVLPNTLVLEWVKRPSQRLKPLRPQDPLYIGPYWLLGRLGTGGMGQLYLGQDARGMLVAVKVVHRRLLEQHPGFRARLRREVELLTQVSPGFTAPVVGCNTDDPQPWLATVFIDAPNLQDIVDIMGPLKPDQLLYLMAGLATTLCILDRRGIVHRDIKPSNILITDSGPLVIDLGIARSTNPALTALTAMGVVLATFTYAAPEQLATTNVPVTHKSDIYSLGKVLTFAATGSPEYLPGLSGRHAALVAQCLNYDPRHRPTAAQLLRELHRLLEVD